MLVAAGCAEMTVISATPGCGRCLAVASHIKLWFPVRVTNRIIRTLAVYSIKQKYDDIN